MKNEVFSAIDKYSMIEENDRVVVGVSGGADSMALLHFLLRIKSDFNLEIIVAHVNHCLRGDESDRDQRFVDDYCAKNDVECYTLSVDVKNGSLKSGMSVEDYGRKVRYDYFSKIAEEHNAKIATAHTLSDSIETSLFNIIRGTGIKGLAGIPPVRDNIIRPLIFVTRAMIEKYCEQNSIEYVTDSSNLSCDYTRNKIRLEIIPKIRDVNGAFEKSFLRLKEQVEDECEYLDFVVRQELKKAKTGDTKYDLNILSNLQKPIVSRLIINEVHKNYGVNLQKSHVDLICKIIKEGTGTVTIPGKVYVKADNGYLKIFKDIPKIKQWETNFNIGEILTDFGKRLIIRVVEKEEYLRLKKNRNNIFNNFLDYDKITESAIFRNRRPGDSFVQKNRGVTKSLKKLFNEQKIPVEEREKLIILEDNSEILWIERFGPSEKVAVSEDTENVVIILTGECEYDKGY